VDEPPSHERSRVLNALASGGSVDPAAEADALLDASNAGGGPLEELLARRLAGEPLAWVIGWVRFCAARIRVDPGVFVPRPQTEALADRAVALLPADGIAVDLCAGSGAVAVVLGAARPRATSSPPTSIPSRSRVLAGTAWRRSWAISMDRCPPRCAGASTS
jgi:release factor glutamine methyltransferase